MSYLHALPVIEIQTSTPIFGYSQEILVEPVKVLHNPFSKKHLAVLVIIRQEYIFNGIAEQLIYLDFVILHEFYSQ